MQKHTHHHAKAQTNVVAVMRKPGGQKAGISFEHSFWKKYVGWPRRKATLALHASYLFVLPVLLYASSKFNFLLLRNHTANIIRRTEYIIKLSSTSTIVFIVRTLTIGTFTYECCRHILSGDVLAPVSNISQRLEYNRKYHEISLSNVLGLIPVPAAIMTTLR